MDCTVVEYAMALGEVDLNEVDRDDMTISVYSIAMQMGWYREIGRSDDGMYVILGEGYDDYDSVD